MANIHISIDAESGLELRSVLADLLAAPVQLPLPLDGAAKIAADNIIREMPSAAPATPATPATPAVSLPSAPEQRKRPGRPRKTEVAQEVAQEAVPAPVQDEYVPAPVVEEPAVPAAEQNTAVAEETEQAPTPDPFSTAPAAEAPKALTHDDARAAMGLVNEKLGMTQCMQLLRSFGVNRIGALGADKLEPFIAKCKELAS